MPSAPPWPERYIETLEELEAKGDREGILRYFHTRAVGLPEEMLDGMRGTPMWDALLALTYTVRYDGLCMGPGSSLPTELLATIETPVLAVSSTGTAMPFLPAAARAVAAGLPKGEYQQLEGGFHEVPAATLAPVIADFIRRELGILYTDSNFFQLEQRLDRIAKMTGVESSLALYLKASKEGITGQFRQCLLDVATNNETSFFRDPSLFRAIEGNQS